jgi:hypothetical protein
MTALDDTTGWLDRGRPDQYELDCSPAGFAGSARFITSQGLKRFDAYEDGQDVIVLNGRGEWTAASVRHLGEQRIWEIELERCRSPHTIETTEDQCWPASTPWRRYQKAGPKYFQTNDLAKVANCVHWKFQTINPIYKPALDHEAILHGIVFGDGTQGSPRPGTRTIRACSIALCNDPQGADSRQLSILFAQAGYKPIDHPERQQINIYGLPKHWKTLPPDAARSEYVRGFVAGWFAADGHVDHRGGGSYLLASAKRDHLVWLQENAARGGLAASTNVQEHHSQSTFGPATWYAIGLNKETLDEEFFLTVEKRSRFTSPKFAKYWKIIAVRDSGRSASTYTVDEPVGRQFVLEGNILTHTCSGSR